MGNSISHTFDKWFGNGETHCLMLGLEGAGKTSTIINMHLGEFSNTFPTIGLFIETITYKGFRMDSWSTHGADKIRILWRNYFRNTQGLIFVVDSSDESQIDDARMEINYLLDEEELRDSVLLVLANKQDLPTAIKPQELAARLRLNRITNRQWHIQGTCAVTCEGLNEGFNWLGEQINNKFK